MIKNLKKVRNKSEVHLGFHSDLPEEKIISSQYIKSKDLTWCSWNIDSVKQLKSL